MENKMEKKVCTKCKIEKSLTEYYKDKNRKDGVRPDCKECNCASRKKWREENPEKVKAIWKKYREENPEKVKASRKKYYQENPEKVKASRKKYYEENAEKERARQKIYRKTHREKERARHKKYYQENPEKERERLRLKESKRRAQKLDTQVEKITPSLLKEYWIKKGIDPQRCYHCNKTFEGLYEHLDHYYPLSKGGGHIKENLVPSCEHCNRTKGNKTPEEWKEFQAL